MLFWGFFLFQVVLAAEKELRINDYVIKIKENTLQSIIAAEESSEELNLSSLGLRGVDKNAFHSLPNLKNLILANNSLTDLPEFVFINLTNLEHLCLAENRISEFENVFIGLSNLETLNISNNPIKFLGKSYMYGLTRSSEIITRGNSLLGISAALFENPFLRKTATKKEKPTAKPVKEETKSQAKNIRVKMCRGDDKIMSVDNLNEDESPPNNCQEVEVGLDGKKLMLDNLGVSEFDEGWYRLQAPLITTISLAGNRIARLSSELLNELPDNIKTVNLSGNKIQRLEKGTIKNRKISTLELSRNLIWEVEDGALKDTKLEELYLKDNKLNDTIFMASLPTSVRIVNLEGNEITRIPVGSFSQLNQLQRLSLYGNKIAELTKQSLSGLLHLEDLDLSNNWVRKIEPGSFQELKSVRVLNLQNNSIASLDKGVFDGLKNLEVLNMGMNKLTKIPKDIRLSLPNTLQRLRLDHNDIERLDTRSFVNVPTETLSLNGNKITKIERGAFNLPTLMTLRLDNNCLSEVNGESFVGLRKLRYLVLEGNGITKLDKGLAKKLGNLVSLNLSKNPIKTLENGALFGLPKSPDTSVFLAGTPVEVIQGGVFDNV